MKTATGTALAEYGDCLDAYRATLAALVAATGRLAETTGADLTELAELGRLSLHVTVDRIVDQAELRYEEPQRLIARTVSYTELLHAADTAAARG